MLCDEVTGIRVGAYDMCSVLSIVGVIYIYRWQIRLEVVPCAKTYQLLPTFQDEISCHPQEELYYGKDDLT